MSPRRHFRVLALIVATIIGLVARGIASDDTPSESLMAQVMASDAAARTRAVLKVRGTKPGKGVARELIARLKSSDRDQRNRAACALKEFGPYWQSEGTSEALVRLLQRDPDGVSPCVGEALASGGKVLHVTLAEAPALLKLNPNSFQYVEGPLAELGEPVVPLMVDTLSSKDVLKKRLALSVLMRIGPRAKAAIPALRTLLKDRSYDTDTGAAITLLQIVPDDDEAVATLIQAYKEKRGNSYQAILALGKLKNRSDVREILDSAYAEKGSATSRAAASALGRPPNLTAAERFPILNAPFLIAFYGAIYLYAFFPLIAAAAFAFLVSWATRRYQDRGTSSGVISFSIAVSAGICFALSAAYILIVGPVNHFHM